MTFEENPMNALQAFHKVQKAAAILMIGWMINNILGFASIGVLIYYIWWQWHLGWLGIVALGIGIWLVNTVALPLLFSLINAPFAQMARSGAIRLIDLGIIDDYTLGKLEKTKVEHWPDVIASSMSNEEFRDKIINSNL